MLSVFASLLNMASRWSICDLRALRETNTQPHEVSLPHPLAWLQLHPLLLIYEGRIGIFSYSPCCMWTVVWLCSLSCS